MTKSQNSSYRQRGSVAVAVALSLVVLVGFLGVVVDLGRMYVVKTELQNAADACALAAAKELDGTTDALTRAENAGITIGGRNNMNFQSTPVSVTAADISFSEHLSPNSAYQTQAAGAPLTSKYAMCTLHLTGLTMTLSSIVGAGPQNVVGQAVATISPAQTACAVPLGVCSKGPAPTYGFSTGEWISGRFDAGGGATGSFDWIDFTPPGGGESELAALLSGPGQCNTSTSTEVGQSGIMGNAAAKAWNSRFGLYQGPLTASTAPPDFSGYTYTPTSWSTQSNALPDFLNQRVSHSSYQGNTATGLSISNGYQVSTPAELTATGADRRLVTAPIVDCSGWASSQTVPIQSYACVLLLHPIGSPGDTVTMEYHGQANDPTSPCATSGLAGGTVGPLVPVLVQ